VMDEYALFEFERAVFMCKNGLTEDEFARLEMLVHVSAIVAESNVSCADDNNVDPLTLEPSVLELFANDPFSSFIN
jgi:hypothetical protein